MNTLFDRQKLIFLYRKRLCALTLLEAQGRLALRAYLETFTDETEALSARFQPVIADCWQRCDAAGGIGDPAPSTGYKLDLVSQETTRRCYVKRMHEQLIEITLSECRKRYAEEEWRPFGMHVKLRLVEEGEEEKKGLVEDEKEDQRLSGEEIVRRFELLRDAWREIAQSLEDGV
jgi:hypothetical protein